MDSWINGVRIGKGSNGISTNTAYGQMVLDDNTSGTGNTATGAYSLVRNTSGSNNSSFGAYAQQFCTSGASNAAFGSLALNLNNGSYNTAVGSRALLRNSSGANNVGVGYAAGELQANGTALSTTNNSIYLGANTKGKDNSDSNSIVIGYGAVSEGANTTVIGNASTTNTHLFGTVRASSFSVAGSPVLTQASATSAGFVNSSDLWEQVSAQLASNAVSLAGGNAYGSFSTAITLGSAYGESSTAMSGGVATGYYSLASGVGAVAASYSSASFGRYTDNRVGSPYSWVETDPLLLVGNGTGNAAGETSNAITTLKNGQTTLTNKAWKSDPAVELTDSNSQGEGLVVEGHTRLTGNTILEGKVIIEQPQGDISMGNYQ